MNPTERQQSLAAARHACDRLDGYKFSVEEVIRFQQQTAPELGFFLYNIQEVITNLVAGFKLLDSGEQKRNEAARNNGQFGKLGGWKKGRKRKSAG